MAFLSCRKFCAVVLAGLLALAPLKPVLGQSLEGPGLKDGAPAFETEISGPPVSQWQGLIENSAAFRDISPDGIKVLAELMGGKARFSPDRTTPLSPRQLRDQASKAANSFYQNTKAAIGQAVKKKKLSAAKREALQSRLDSLRHVAALLSPNWDGSEHERTAAVQAPQDATAARKRRRPYALEAGSAAAAQAGPAIADLSKISPAYRYQNPAAQGYFGEKSMMWEILGHKVVYFFSLARAAAMQDFLPPVAQSATLTRELLDNTLARIIRTDKSVNGIIYGDMDTARTLQNRVNRMHANLPPIIMDETVGRFRQGQQFQVADPQSMRWVWATLVDSAFYVHQHYVRALNAQEKAKFYNEWRLFGKLFGVSDDPASKAPMPANYADFQLYMRKMLHGGDLALGNVGKRLAKAFFKMLDDPKLGGHFFPDLMPEISVPIGPNGVEYLANTRPARLAFRMAVRVWKILALGSLPEPVRELLVAAKIPGISWGPLEKAMYWAKDAAFQAAVSTATAIPGLNNFMYRKTYWEARGRA